MARVNKRDEVLDAISTIIERDGLTAVTLDAVASKTGMTRAGLLYHFPSRDALIHATHEHLTGLWERDLIENAGKSADAATDKERYTAYINVCAKAARRSELILLLESSENKDLGQLWQRIIDTWAPQVPDVENADELDAFIARLAADGLWIHEVLSSRPLAAAVRKKIVIRLGQLLDQGVKPGRQA